MLNERLQARLEELRAEFAKGEQTLSDLEAQTTSVRTTLLRISGAIQVLEELSREEDPVARVDEPSRLNGQIPVAVVG
jgi:hypothetical protein